MTLTNLKSQVSETEKRKTEKKKKKVKGGPKKKVQKGNSCKEAGPPI